VLGGGLKFIVRGGRPCRLLRQRIVRGGRIGEMGRTDPSANGVAIEVELKTDKLLCLDGRNPLKQPVSGFIRIVIFGGRVDIIGIPEVAR
jgi:hypothetical protein